MTTVGPLQWLSHQDASIWQALPVETGLAAVLILGIAGGVALVGRRNRRRHRELEEAVRGRTEELERERVLEKSRSSILEQLVSNQSLGAVLDSIAIHAREETAGLRCAILLKRPSRWFFGAAPGIGAQWLAALRTPGALPAEVWRKDCDWTAPATEAAWQPFFSALSGQQPRAIYSRVIGSGEALLGVLLAFADQPPTQGSSRLETALRRGARLAFIAIEHANFYEDLNYRAHHDSLTGLPNDVLFEHQLTSAVREAATLTQQLALLSIDIDHFRRINDAIGHAAADVVLTEIAARIKRAIRGTDMVARSGGDEFNVILPGLARTEEADEICRRILEAVAQPMLVDGKLLTPTASVGSALFPLDGTKTEELRRKSNAALQWAKNLGRNRLQTYAGGNDAPDRVRLEQEIRDALEQERFAVYYQPKIDASGGFCGLEALLRLSGSGGGPIPPVAFIPVAEESGLIVQLGAWVLAEVCRQIRAWHGQGLGWIPVAVNVSPLQISRPGFTSEVRQCLHSYGVPPQSLELELTESILLGGGEAGERHMRELREAGIRFSIDDFGTGYSSLSYLYRLPVDAIKLDRSFVSAIDNDDAARRLVQAMIGVADGLGLDVVAEGVETEEQRSALISLGCPVMQGYLFARPGPATEIERFLIKHPVPVGDWSGPDQSQVPGTVTAEANLQAV